MTKESRGTREERLFGTLGSSLSLPSLPAMGAQRLRLPRELGRAIAWLVPLTLLAAVGLIVWRRWAGALVHPPEAPIVLAVAVGAASLAAAMRFGRLGRGCVTPRHIAYWLPLPALLLLGWAISLPETSLAVLATLWSVLLGGEVVSALVAGRTMRRAASVPPAVVPTPALASAPVGVTVDRVADEAACPMAELDAPEELVAPSPSSNVMQQLTRSQAADGSEILSGWLRLAFAPGQRNTSAHVAFCPPFARAPTVVIEQHEGPSARIKTAQVLPLGARLEVKLAAVPELPVHLVVRLTATC